MKRDRFVPDAAPNPVVDADMAQALRLSCVELAAKMVGNRGPSEVIQTAEIFVAYVQTGAMKVE